MKKKLVVAMLMGAIVSGIPIGVMAEESTEQSAVEAAVEVQGEASDELASKILGYWSGISVSQKDTEQYYSIALVFIDGKVVFGLEDCLSPDQNLGTYQLKGNEMTVTLDENNSKSLFGTNENITGVVSVGELEVTEQMAEYLPESKLEYVQYNNPECFTFTVSLEDNSNPLAPAIVDQVYKFFRKDDVGEDYSRLVIFDASWQLDNGLQLAFDADGKTTLTQQDGSTVVSDSNASIYYGNRLNVHLGSSLYYVIDDLKQDEITMHLESDPDTPIHMIRMK